MEEHQRFSAVRAVDGLAYLLLVTATVVTVAALFYLLFSDGGWEHTIRWILASIVAVFVAVGWSQAAALAKRGLPAGVLLSGTLAATACLFAFAAALIR